MAWKTEIGCPSSSCSAASCAGTSSGERGQGFHRSTTMVTPASFRHYEQYRLRSAVATQMSVPAQMTPLLDWLQHSVDEEFVSIENQNQILVNNDPKELLDMVLSAEMPSSDTWIERLNVDFSKIPKD